MNDERLRALLADAHRDDPAIPFARVMARARASRKPRLVPRVAFAASLAAILAIGVFASRHAKPAVTPPLAHWRAPTDFLLASSPRKNPTGFLLRRDPLTDLEGDHP